MKAWQALDDIEELDWHAAIELAVYDKGSYDSPEAAEASGGLYKASNHMMGRAQVYDCVDGIAVAAQCMDANNGLVIVFRKAV